MTNLLLENKIPEVLNNFNAILAKGFEGHHFINGLASHFRDILVAKDNSTINLLEVGDNAKKKYLEQSSKASISFLIQAIEKANQCDLNYRTSKNQRLLVELTLMQIASITFDGEKKKSANYIIPATFFTSIFPVKKQEIIEKPKPIKKEVTENSVEKVVSDAKEISKPPILQNLKRRNNSLSLKSIHHKKEQQKKPIEINYENHPKNSFSEKDLQKTWSEYQKLLIKKGEKSIASILAAADPKLLENFNVQFTLPNKLMKAQLKIGKPKLLKFLREALNNFSITITVIVNETIEKKFAYTPQEKYNKLLEKNSSLKSLKDTFQLDL